MDKKEIETSISKIEAEINQIIAFGILLTEETQLQLAEKFATLTKLRELRDGTE